MAGTESDSVHDVVVVGAGAAGVGAAVALKHAGIDNFVVSERRTVGASFASWPAETRFITPSFPTNSIGMLDLNSIAIGTSPAFSLGVEHPTGEEYASYLRAVAQFFELPIRQNTDVKQIAKVDDGFRLDTADGTLHAKHVVWAAGEFQYPRLNGFVGSQLCRHIATIASYEELDGDDFVVVGGFESGVDAGLPPGVSRQTSAVVRPGLPVGGREFRSQCRAFPVHSSNGCAKTSLLSKWNCFRTPLSNRSLAWMACMTLRLGRASVSNPRAAAIGKRIRGRPQVGRGHVRTPRRWLSAAERTR